MSVLECYVDLHVLECSFTRCSKHLERDSGLVLVGGTDLVTCLWAVCTAGLRAVRQHVLFSFPWSLSDKVSLTVHCESCSHSGGVLSAP